MNANGVPSFSPGLPQSGYPGSPLKTRTTLKGLRSSRDVPRRTTQPPWGWIPLTGEPRVGARSSHQPWAGGHNAFGVLSPPGFRHSECVNRIKTLDRPVPAPRRARLPHLHLRASRPHPCVQNDRKLLLPLALGSRVENSPLSQRWFCRHPLWRILPPPRTRTRHHPHPQGSGRGEVAPQRPVPTGDSFR